MGQSVNTTWSPGRPNQQLVDHQRLAAARAPAEQQRQAALHALGAQLRTTFAHTPIPLLAVQTHYSLLEGTASPAAWATVLSTWFAVDVVAAPDRRGGNFAAGAAAVVRAAAALVHASQTTSEPLPTAQRTPTAGILAALTDRDDLLALPAIIDHWGSRAAIGSIVQVDGDDVVLLARNADGYRGLCRLLSARHAGDDHAHCFENLRPTERQGLVTLVRNAHTGQRFATHGATVYWRADVRPAPEGTPFPAVAVPLLTHIADDRAAAGVLAAMRRRGTISAHDRGGTALADLLALPNAYRGYEEQLVRSAALRQQTWYVPTINTTGHDLHLPPLPPVLRGCDPDRELRRLAEAGIAQRYGQETPALRTRLEHELTVIQQKGFAAYLLTVWSIAHKRRTCGRGSAASSVVVYLLGITNVDPLAAHLLFERFLAPERIEPPDVDIDFAWDERDGVFSEILRDFGADHVALVATHLHLHNDGALREAARAHGLGDAAITAMHERLHDLARYGRSRDDATNDALPPPWPTIINAAAHITNAPRHLGVHCGGVVITAKPLATIVPVHPAAKHIPDPDESAALRAMPAIAWEKDGAEALRLVKIDVLGNRSLAVIRDCIADLTAWGQWPTRFRDDHVWSSETQCDDATRHLLATGDTIGCFYIESPAMRQLQAKVGSGDFDRLVVHSSIIRPAGMDFIRTYIARHHVLHDPTLSDEQKKTRIKNERWYPHPVLQQLLSESYGVLSYQEDVMVVAQHMAGFTSADANTLRKALGRNDTAERLAALVDRFRSGCRANGIDADTITLVWRMISSFAGYSFAKAHSASYAVVSFQCAWLKAHHPAVFLARVIANEGGFYGASAYVEAARRLGIRILAPCVLYSVWPTRAADDDSIRIGFHRVKELSRATADAIVTARQQHPFSGIGDFIRRTSCARDEAQALLEAGAFDALLVRCTPAQCAWTVASVLRRITSTTNSASDGQAFIGLVLDDERDPTPPSLPDVAPALLAWRLFRRLGLLPSAHPLTLWRIDRRPSLRMRDLTLHRSGQHVYVVGIVITRKDVNAIARDRDKPEKTHVEDMAFVTIEDETGLVETTWFPAIYRRYAVLLERSEPLLIGGIIDVDFSVVALNVRSCATCAVPLT